MKKIIVPALMCLLLASPVFAKGKAKSKHSTKSKAQKKTAASKEVVYHPIPLGSPIPNEGLMFENANSSPSSLAQAKTDKGLLVMFTSNTCPFVIKAQKHTLEAINFCRDQGIGVALINSNEATRTGDDSFDEMKKYAQAQHYLFPYLKDDGSQMANAFGASRTPEVFLFNGQGILVYKGAIEENPSNPDASRVNYLRNALSALVKGITIEVTETKSIGCGIKR